MIKLISVNCNGLSITLASFVLSQSFTYSALFRVPVQGNMVSVQVVAFYFDPTAITFTERTYVL